MLSFHLSQLKQAVWPPGSADTVYPRPPVTLTFDRLTLKLVCESHVRLKTFLANLGTLGLWVLELFAMYATDGQTDGRMDKSNAYCPFHTVVGITSGVSMYQFVRTGNKMIQELTSLIIPYSCHI